MYEIRYFVRITTMIYVCTCSHRLNRVRFLVSNMSNENGRPIKQIKKLHPYGGSYSFLPTFYTRAYICFTNSIVSSLAAGRTINAWIPDWTSTSWWKSKYYTKLHLHKGKYVRNQCHSWITWRYSFPMINWPTSMEITQPNG